MNLKQTERLLNLLRRHGVQHFKSLECEVSFDSHLGQLPEEPLVMHSKASVKGPEPQAIPPVEMDIPHKTNEVMSVLKMSDEELVDKLFPIEESDGD